jgi:threonine/homoserine/homoserine lactone efflux protein
MGQAIGESLPLAIGVAVSPIPIIAIILMLLSKRAGSNSATFLAGWVIGIVAVVSIVVAVAGTTDLDGTTGQAAGTSWLKVALGVALLLVGARHWRQRPKKGEPAALPKWLASIETITPLKAGGLGFVLSAVNPKNLILMVAAGVAIAQGASGAGEKAGSIVVFLLIAASTVILPVLLYWIMGERAQPTLDSANEWLTQNNSAVMAVLILVIGVALIGKGIDFLG